MFKVSVYNDRFWEYAVFFLWNGACAQIEKKSFQC